LDTRCGACRANVHPTISANFWNCYEIWGRETTDKLRRCARRRNAPAKFAAGSTGRELRALRRLRRETESSPFIFVSERGAPFSVAGFQKLVARAGEKAGFDFPVHPHMLRHACGYALANAGQDTRALQAYLGHRCIQHTTIYTELSPERFKSFWKD
jgi:site-specific recombinase XerD